MEDDIIHAQALRYIIVSSVRNSDFARDKNSSNTFKRAQNKKALFN